MPRQLLMRHKQIPQFFLVLSSHVSEWEAFVAICLRHGPVRNLGICRKNMRDKFAQGKTEFSRIPKRIPDPETRTEHTRSPEDTQDVSNSGYK